MEWSSWPLRGRPGRTVLLITIIALLASLVLYWLGWSWPSGMLLLAFLFSVRDVLFPRTVRLDQSGITVSHPLTGARHFDWDQVEPLRLHDGLLAVRPRRSRPLTMPVGEAHLIEQISDWQDWHRQWLEAEALA